MAFPRCLPTDFPMVLVFAAKLMRPSPIKTVVAGAVFIRSPRLRPAATDTVKDHADSLSVKPVIESGTNFPQAIRQEAGISPACFRGRW